MAAKRASAAAGFVQCLSDACEHSSILRQIELTHNTIPSKHPDFDLYALLRLVNDILKDCVVPNPKSSTRQKDAKSLNPHLQSIFKELYAELAFRSLDSVDEHRTVVNFFKKLSDYSWEAKMCVVLTVMVTIYGEYWVLIQSYFEGDEQMTKNVVKLLQLRDRKAEYEERKSYFDKVNDLIKSMVDYLNEYIAKSSEIDDEEALLSNVIIASYWVVRSVVQCTSYIHSLFRKVYKSSIGDEDIQRMTIKIEGLGAACMDKIEITKFKQSHKIRHDVGAIKIGAWGGKGGHEWAYLPNPKALIHQITIHYGDQIDSITFTSVNPNGGFEPPSTFGGDGGSYSAQVKLDSPGEHLIGISGTINSRKMFVNSLKFKTNVKEYGPFVGNIKAKDGETPFSFSMENNGVIVGFHGRCGLYLDSIGMFVRYK